MADVILLEKYESVSYVCLGVNVALIAVSILQSFRVFRKEKTKGFLLILLSLLFQILSTIVTFTGGYWDVENGATYTSVDACLYPFMVIFTYCAYTYRIVTLEKLPVLNKYAKAIPVAIVLLLIPDDISYVLSAWITDNESVNTFSFVTIIIDQIVFVICSFAIYYMLLAKMSRYLTVKKARILAKVIAIVCLLISLDVFLAVLSQLVIFFNIGR
eukprot:NODE_175_length_14138_cov_1.015314.p8 type:complete len:215 gc:universal NODE_175_length_14138_cov_1.015314:5435-4791(-)